jgi:hypothetical protein
MAADLARNQLQLGVHQQKSEHYLPPWQPASLWLFRRTIEVGLTVIKNKSMLPDSQSTFIELTVSRYRWHPEY